MKMFLLVAMAMASSSAFAGFRCSAENGKHVVIEVFGNSRLRHSFHPTFDNENDCLQYIAPMNKPTAEAPVEVTQPSETEEVAS